MIVLTEIQATLIGEIEEKHHRCENEAVEAEKIALQKLLIRIGMYDFKKGSLSFTPVLAQEFFSLLPVFNLRWAMNIVTNALMIANGSM